MHPGGGMTDEVLVTLHDRYELHVGLDRRSGDSISSTFPEDVNSRQSSDTYRRILSIANEQSGVVTESVARHEPLSKRHYFDGGIDTNFIANALLTFTAGGSAVAFL